jgi:hypothetical protein
VVHPGRFTFFTKTARIRQTAGEDGNHGHTLVRVHRDILRSSLQHCLMLGILNGGCLELAQDPAKWLPGSENFHVS